MSYCHMTNGINFLHGFGPEPKQRMLEEIANSRRLSHCEGGSYM